MCCQVLKNQEWGTNDLRIMIYYSNLATNHSKILTNYASIKLLRKNMQKQKLVVVKQILCRCISLNTTRIEDITEIAVIMFDFSKHFRDIFQGATWDVSAADL